MTSIKNTLLAAGFLVASAGMAHAEILSPLQDVLDSHHPIANFEFEGFYQFAVDGQTVGQPQRISGIISLDLLTFGGTADMSGFFGNLPFTAIGPLSANVNPLGLLGVNGGPCNGPTTNLLCADAKINFAIGGENVPVDASFGLQPANPFANLDFNNLDLGLVLNVTSLDSDGNGAPGDVIECECGFVGIEPFFTGTARLVSLDLGNFLPNPNLSGAPAVPEPETYAMLLAGLGLVAYKIRSRRRIEI